ncbi:hypothetical protein PVAG01_11017 [Phlyctema vagabunda]|uniref:Uncharacterized protein n=1 Tax=Phlyctema vagabunda TaxID=108571 RepID=A0ABR4P3W2_9HELO
MNTLNTNIRGSLLSGVQETTLTLANLNFDFSLYKVEAPTEYQALGKALSKQRREAVETGSEHIFARKLGALFAQSLPATPNLIRAYGLRSSEIAELPAVNPQGSRADDMFQDWMGADATSIWAAATSGPGAIAMHLLACMLARSWSAAEATAIWDEIIKARKQELSNMDPMEPLNLATVSAAQIDISREQMSNWDASARAWLSVADAAKFREQTQLMLLLKNFPLPVNQNVMVYSSVMEAWRSAMSTIDKIIGGMPHSIQDGAVLLGLASWHLYPDMYVLKASHPEVLLKDPLVSPNGIVTLGISSRSPDSEDGVYWSLPLAYLRYYGDPVSATSTIGESTTRLNLSDFFMVILGAVLSGWGKYGDDLQQALKLVVALSEFLLTSLPAGPKEPVSWLQLLVKASREYFRSNGSHRVYLESLISRGRRRHRNFLAEPSESPLPIFGMSHTQYLLPLIDDVEKRVSTLRFLAKSLNLRPGSLLIRYRRPAKVVFRDSSHLFEHFQNAFSSPDKGPEKPYEWCFATALKVNHTLGRGSKSPTRI